MNISQWLERAATRWPTAPALYKGLACTADYAAFHRKAAGIAGWLAARGILPGARVALFMKNEPEYLIALHGIWMAGAAAVPINAKLHFNEANWILSASGASLVFVTAGQEAGLDEVPVIEVTGPDFLAATETPSTTTESRRAEDLAWLFYTSGTTGRPKGVKITHGMLAAMSMCYLIDVDDVRADDAALYAAPMSHGAGLYSLVHILKGTGHVFPTSGSYDASEFLDLAEAHGSVSAFLAPTMIHRLTAEAQASGRHGKGIRTIVYGGGPMYRADIEAALDHFGPKFVQIYGQGECPMAITVLSREEIANREHPDWKTRIESVGRPQSAVEVRILDEDGTPRPAGRLGEIAVRGLPVMPGYWRAPEANTATLRDGWLMTGDIGVMDESGLVTLRDRAKDLIISGGSNIYPREVEEVLLSHPAVEQVAVVGRPSAEWGEEVVAYVVPAEGSECSQQLLDEHCLAHIARFKRPKMYFFIPDLPKNAYGKVLKSDLRKAQVVC